MTRRLAGLLRALFMLAGFAASAVVASPPATDQAQGRSVEFQRQLQMRSDAYIRQEFNRRIEAMGSGQDIAGEVLLLDISPADFAWTLAMESIYLDDIEEGNVTAEGFLESPELQLAFKLVADVSAQPYSGATSLVPNSGEYEDALFASFASDLAPLAHLRETGAKVEDLLWLQAVRRFDQAMLAMGEATAADLLSMPRYWLARKIMADAVAASMADCVRCSDSNAEYYDERLCGPHWCDRQLDFMRACDIAKAVCESAPFRNCGKVFNAMKQEYDSSQAERGKFPAGGPLSLPASCSDPSPCALRCLQSSGT